ncbi:PAS domain-containing hybrid sensor histidine kinase/response regulator [Variovorax jilinensis]|uniref:PAS domain-containing hybrid sensor histidine kinase/response regulator n=1 Tax=Variovorax jilinensis TaxID=3053513 RepID=UPI002577FE9F|nr:PAS domain-containing protein [Variovorax sp. J22P168]
MSDPSTRLLEDLSRSEARFHHLVEATGDVVWITECDPERVVYCSQSFEDIWGYSVEALYREPVLWIQCIHDDDRERIGRTFHAWLSQPMGRWEAEFRIVRPDGEVRWIHERGVAMVEGDGKMRVVGASADITRLRLTAAALRESEERFALAVEGSADGIWDWDLQTGMMFMSERAQSLYGLPPSADALRPRAEWMALVLEPQADVAARRDAIARYVAGESDSLDAEWLFRQPDGTDRWRRIRGRCLRNAEGKATRLSGSISDVDARKREQASRQQSQRLEAVGTFAGGIAHDFNNILGAILGFGEISLRRTRSGSRMRRDLESILTAGERGRSLVDRILAFSRSSISERTLVHFEQVARESVDLLKPALQGEIDLECDFRAGTAAIMGDPTQVHQIVGNLAINAIQAMPNGGVLRIVLECASLLQGRSVTTGSMDGGEYVALTVSDTGIGIAPENRQRIFDPFFTTKEVNLGTGLGLSLVHGIVTELGGAIDVSSSVGNGSTFVVYLPRMGDVPHSRAIAPQRLPRGTKQHVLVIDDDPALSSLTSRLCSDLGYRWTACTSSTEAARIFREGPDVFDAVLTDERMPGMSGIALMRSLKEVRPDIPVIMMSGYLGDTLVNRARASGALAVLAKPVAKADLATALASVFAGSVASANGRRDGRQ